MTFRFNLVSIVPIIFLLLLQYPSIQTHIFYSEKHSSFTFHSIGTYADGTILAQVKFKKDFTYADETILAQAKFKKDLNFR
jgi:hypothetical protein